MPNASAPNFSDLIRRLKYPILLAIGVIVVGTVGYYLLWLSEGGTWLDALYMTFITITTVGYNEIHPLRGVGRIFTVFIAITGIASLFYLFTAVMEHLVAVQLSGQGERRRMKEKIAQLGKHIILAGFGRMGQQAASELRESEEAFVVVDNDDVVLDVAEREGYLFVRGDATEDDVLELAGIERAKGLIAAAGNDASNAFIAMSARALNRDLLIIARADEDAALRKLKQAGADRVINPYAVGGRRLVNLAINPAVIDFLETTLMRGQAALGVQEFEVQPASTFEGKSLGSLDLRRRSGVNILAILRGSEPISNPDADFTLQAGDHLISLGTVQQFDKLAELAQEDEAALQG